MQPAGSLGATASVAALALMQADMVEAKQPDMAREYRCWALSQVRPAAQRQACCE